MVAILSGLGYVTAFGALMFWLMLAHSERASKWLSRLFIFSILSYLIFQLIRDEPAVGKMISIARDMLVMGIAAGVIYFIHRKNRMASFFAGMVLLFGFIWFYMPFVMIDAPPQGKAESRLEPNGEWLVEIKDLSNLGELQALCQEDSVRFMPAFRMANRDETELDDYLVADLKELNPKQAADLREKILQSGLVNDIEDNEKFQVDDPILKEAPVLSNADYSINDPLANQQWALASFQMNEYYQLLSKVQAPEKPIILAILDTGIDTGHEDLRGQTVSIDPKFDNDPQGHGTHCACIAGAITNNRLGIASLLNGQSFFKLMSVTVLNNMGSGSQQSTIQGILQAADAGAQVISMSLGGFSNDSKQRAYNQAVSYANRKGAILVVAAGNANRNAKSYSPANVEGVIAVSAVDNQKGRASFSNTVDDLKMGIAAPGVNIISCLPGNRYLPQNGTSMATPYVAGLVAMMKAIRPTANTEDIYEVIRKNGVATKDEKQTGKFIQPAATLRAWLNQ